MRSKGSIQFYSYRKPVVQQASPAHVVVVFTNPSTEAFTHGSSKEIYLKMFGYLG